MLRANPPSARAALRHPLFLAGLFVLAVNDHLLKGSGILPGVVRTMMWMRASADSDR